MDIHITEKEILNAIKSYYKSTDKQAMLDKIESLERDRPITFFTCDPYSFLSVLPLDNTEIDCNGNIAYRGFVTIPYYLWFNLSDRQLIDSSSSDVVDTGSDSVRT